MDIWSLPGPSSFVHDIENAVRDGSNVILRFPIKIPNGLERELRERLHSLLNWNSVDASDIGIDPFAYLLQQYCPDGNIADLAANTSFQGRLIWVENINHEMWPNWSTFLKAYSDACRNVDVLYRTVFIALLSGKTVVNRVAEEVALACHDFRGVLDILDLFVLALCKIPESIKQRDQRALLAHTIAQVAQWDSFLADRLLALPIKEALKPEDILRQYAIEHGWTSETPRSWEMGTLGGTLEKPTVHSALLEVCGDSRLVRQRIWAAQAAVLLPLIEEQRVTFLDQNKEYLNLPIKTQDGRHIQDALDLEVGELAWHFDRRDKPHKLRNQVKNLRLFRNKLAHMEPLQPEDALRVVSFSQ